MGIPYSRQIHSAFDQITPLVASGSDVLRTTKNISILLALIQLLTVFLLWLIWLALLGVLITVNPDLQTERQAIVTPVMEWLAAWVKRRCDRMWLEVVIFTVMAGVGAGTWAGVYFTREHTRHKGVVRTGEGVPVDMVEAMQMGTVGEAGAEDGEGKATAAGG
ncbi:hypothetical protein QBC46DRAFT_423938 [Diplogelasinospora grovesii]|uniref:Uncharacterized protein n=1 Tax=Diplogelasinospora grovesii TaxID=303347 RepID=A0AAN6S6F8_9PEZI|nr:hypothetical protein QBC46DRAFT_423938 [Diplogelasinospora grovesii]